MKTQEVAVKHPRIGVASVVKRNGKILLGKRKGNHAPDYWGFPGGHLEFGESVETCAIRELLEETGLVANSCQLSSWVENVMDGERKHYITIFAVMSSPAGEPAVLEPEKCAGWEWFGRDELPTPLFSPIPSFMEKEPDQFDHFFS